MWNRIAEILCEGDTFFIATHVNPDGDGVGSAAALIELLLTLGKKVYFVLNETVSSKYAFLNFREKFISYRALGNELKPDVLIVLDTNRPERLGPVAEIAGRSEVKVLCIDHHRAAEKFADEEVIDLSACSVGAMIYDLYEYMGKEPSLNALKGIYTSVVFDTGRFSYASTNSQAHKIAEHCISCGVDPSQMYQALFQSVTFEKCQIFSKVLQESKRYFDDQVLCLNFSHESFDPYGIDIENVDLEFVFEFCKVLSGVRCIVLLRGLPSQKVRISVRSRHFWDVSKLCHKIGGGGHAKAAGALVAGTVESVEANVLSLIEDMYLNPA